MNHYKQRLKPLLRLQETRLGQLRALAYPQSDITSTTPQTLIQFIGLFFTNAILTKTIQYTINSSILQSKIISPDDFLTLI